MPERLHDRLLKTLAPPLKGNCIVYDTEVRGFGVRLTAKGNRAFVLNYVAHGRERRLTIGSFPDWSTTAAREEARRLKRLIDQGIDPLEQKALQSTAIQAERDAPTMRDLFERYAREHLLRKAPRSAADDRSMWQKLILPVLGPLKVKDVRHEDVDALHAHISATRPVRANRVIEVVRKAFNLAIRWQWRTDNPASGVHRNREERRARYLSPNELVRLDRALARHPETVSAAAIRLMALTGARRGEVLNAIWQQFDLDAAVWVKPASGTKQRRLHRVPLSTTAVAMLRDLRQKSTSPHVFAGASGRPLTDVKRTWRSVCNDAGIDNCRLHDLRHSYASVLASAGLSLPVIGALLGHSQPQTTSRYAHLLDEPLRAAQEHVAQTLEGK